MEKGFRSIVTEKVTQNLVRLVAFLSPTFMPIVFIPGTRGIEPLHGNLIRTLGQVTDFLIDLPILSVPHLRNPRTIVLEIPVTGLCPTIIAPRKIGIHHQAGHIVRSPVCQSFHHRFTENPVGTGLDAI